jgi:hypothetical protein
MLALHLHKLQSSLAFLELVCILLYAFALQENNIRPLGEYGVGLGWGFDGT